MHRILCSTGALIGRPNGRDWRLLTGCRERLQCDGYEFMFYDTWYQEAEKIAAFVEKIGLPVLAWHCEKGVGELLAENERAEAARLFSLNCQMAAGLGARLMVLHLWNGQISDAHVERNIAAVPMLLEIAEKHGIELTVENVVCSHRDPLTNWRAMLKQYPDTGLTLDTKMAAFHNQLEDLYAPENDDLWQKNIRHIHVNDYGGEYRNFADLRTLHPGQGRIDFAPFFRRLRAARYAGDFTVEATSFLPDGVIHWDDLNRTFAWLRENLSLDAEQAEGHGPGDAAAG